jgi:hypothetical protein
MMGIMIHHKEHREHKEKKEIVKHTQTAVLSTCGLNVETNDEGE